MDDYQELPGQEAEASKPSEPTGSDLAGAVTVVTNGLVSSLKDFQSFQRFSPGPKSDLILPGRILTYLGMTMLLVSTGRRFLSFPYYQIEFRDFVAILIVGAALLLVGVFLFVYQYRTEHAPVVGIVDTAKEAARGLIAHRGPDTPMKTDRSSVEKSS
jgi:hypothetical protein